METSTSSLNRWLPKSFTALQHYNKRDFVSDLAAGLTVGLVALPLAMAFAIASGLTPQAGIYCAVVTGFVISAFGGSKVQIGGPTGAFVVVVYGIIAKHGVQGLFICTMMAGIILVVMGLTGMGRAVQFIPRPVVLGFTNGIAVLIASTQIRDFFGIHLETNPGQFFARMLEIGNHASTFSMEATVLAAVSLFAILIMPRFSKRVPGYIVALLLGTLAAHYLHLQVDTIGSRFGGVPRGLPHFRIPDFSSELILPLISPALTVAMLGAIESLMSAVVADRMTGDKHNPNTELVAQGMANIVSPIFGGLPATGAIARTATNIRAGAKTPLAGIIHAITLLLILMFAAPLARFIPLAVLAAILMVVSYNMGEWAETVRLLRLNFSSVLVWATTFVLTVVADLTTAVEFGMVMAALIFIRKIAETTTVSAVTKNYILTGKAHVLHDKHIPDYVEIYRIQGALLFGSAQKLAVVTDHLDRLPPVIILRLRSMSAIDSTGIGEIEEVAKRVHESGRLLVLCGAHPQPAKMMRQPVFEALIGKENILPDIQSALDRASEWVKQSSAAAKV